MFLFIMVIFLSALVLGLGWKLKNAIKEIEFYKKLYYDILAKFEDVNFNFKNSFNNSKSEIWNHNFRLLLEGGYVCNTTFSKLTMKLILGRFTFNILNYNSKFCDLVKFAYGKLYPNEEFSIVAQKFQNSEDSNCFVIEFGEPYPNAQYRDMANRVLYIEHIIQTILPEVFAQNKEVMTIVEKSDNRLKYIPCLVE